MTQENTPHVSAQLTPAAIAMALIVVVCWGGNFAASKMAMQHFPPFLFIWLRFAALTLLLAPFALRTRVNMRDMFVISLFYITLHFTLIFFGMSQGLSIATTVVAVQLGAPFSCVLAAIFHNDRLGPWRSFGMMIAFMGVLLLAGTPNVAAHWGAFLLVVAGAFFWASANIYMKRVGNIGVAAFLFWPALLSLPQVGLLTLLFEEGQWNAVRDASLPAWAGVLYSMLFSSLVGYGLWYRLLRTYPLSRVTPFSLLVPLVGIGGGVVFYNENVTPLLLAGAALTIIGVGVITLRRPRLALLDKFS